MLGKSLEIRRGVFQIVDGCLIAFAFYVAHLIRADFIPLLFPDTVPIPNFGDFTPLICLVAPLSPIFLEIFGYYRRIPNRDIRAVIWQYIQTLVWVGVFVGGMVIFLQWESHSRAVLILQFFLSGIFLLARNHLTLRHEEGIHEREDRLDRVLLVGDQDGIDHLSPRFSEERLGFSKIIAHLKIDETEEQEFYKMLVDHSVARVLFTLNQLQTEKLNRLLRVCDDLGVEACFSIDFIKTSHARPHFDTYSGIPVLIFRSAPGVSWSLEVKRWMDLCCSALGLIVLSPVFLFIALGIKLSSRGPVFFTQERSGLHGKTFMMWKFRSMVVGAETQQQKLNEQNEMMGPVFKLKQDPRVFAFGAFIRKFSLDELPQLFNVLRGEMSLVGPRPLPVYEVKKIDSASQRRRMSVKPGLTCLWQVSGRNDISSFEEWVNLDLKYIDNWSLGLDLKILFQTIPVVLIGSGAH